MKIRLGSHANQVGKKLRRSIYAQVKFCWFPSLTPPILQRKARPTTIPYLPYHAGDRSRGTLTK